MSAFRNGERDAREPQIVEPTGHPRLGPRWTEVVVPEARRDEWVPRLVHENEPVEAGRRETRQVIGQLAGCLR